VQGGGCAVLRGRCAVQTGVIFATVQPAKLNSPL
jgi:hypothetical protein